MKSVPTAAIHYVLCGDLREKRSQEFQPDPGGGAEVFTRTCRATPTTSVRGLLQPLSSLSTTPRNSTFTPCAYWAPVVHGLESRPLNRGAILLMLVGVATQHVRPPRPHVHPGPAAAGHQPLLLGHLHRLGLCHLLPVHRIHLSQQHRAGRRHCVAGHHRHHRPQPGLSGDTLEMMQAVLDTNFWLATHVTCVTLGYTATFVAGLPRHCSTSFCGVFTPSLDSRACARCWPR